VGSQEQTRRTNPVSLPNIQYLEEVWQDQILTYHIPRAKRNLLFRAHALYQLI
jgi:hypothetical protein